jgi:hypothetical protein
LKFEFASGQNNDFLQQVGREHVKHKDSFRSAKKEMAEAIDSRNALDLEYKRKWLAIDKKVIEMEAKREYLDGMIVGCRP